MKIALFFFGDNLPTDGVRLISAILKRDSHDVCTLFIPTHALAGFSSRELDEAHSILGSSELVLMSVYSAFAKHAGRITDLIHLRYPGLLVVWGGPHCIAGPEIALRHADAVCFGEADDVLSSFVSLFAAGDSRYRETANMAFRVEGKTIINKPEAPFANIDMLPFYDYSLENSFVLTNTLTPLSREHFLRYTSEFPLSGYKTLTMLTSRGCPHQCSYCNNCRFVAIFGKNAIRCQSVNRFMDELESILKRHDFFRTVFFGDDDFMIRSQAELDEFGARYKKTVGLPFSVCASARTFTKEKFKTLLDAGCKSLRIGLQTASKRVLTEIYNRHLSPDKIMDVARTVAAMTKGTDFKLFMDLIVDNPYESHKEMLETFRYAIDLPRENILLQGWKLCFFPGTPIYERAVKDGYCSGVDDADFTLFDGQVKYQVNYPTLLLLIIKRPRIRKLLPRPFLAFLASPLIVGLMSLVPPAVLRPLCRLR